MNSERFNVEATQKRAWTTPVVPFLAVVIVNIDDERISEVMANGWFACAGSDVGDD